MRRVQQYMAFTLAEVLITLGVIGIVAVLTIPTLVKNYQKMVYYTAFQKGYAELTLVVEALTLENSDMAGASAEYGCLVDAFKSKVKAKYCPSGTMAGECMSSEFKNVDGSDQGDPGFEGYDRFVLADGESIAFQVFDEDCAGSFGNYTDICGQIYLDTNGLKKPNELGRDIFYLMLRKNKLEAYGAPGSGLQEWLYWYCNPDITDPNSGVSCSEKLVEDGKMSY